MSDDYFYETYGVDKPDNYEELIKAKEARTPDPNMKPEEKEETEDSTEEEDKEDEKDDSPERKTNKKKENFFKNLFSSFFQDAPKGDKGAALEF